eukprot:TRINITY_DN950_c6_g1_i1.p1 TRINITY_DN950_c6_g1~~TRINITY_DN950_c6_g1_i1.p1  ORF type:complete len:161 (+),score=21.68 TRINITY_DN950_c6_g1_i1:55-483(+)
MRRLRVLGGHFLPRSMVQTRACSGRVGPEGDTVFGKIIRNEIPASKVYEDDEVLAFNDVSPQAPVHILIIPKRRIQGVSHAADTDAELLGKLLVTARKVAEKLEVHESGYRLVVNDGKHGCQTVDHIHVHLLAGRQLTWPPG